MDSNADGRVGAAENVVGFPPGGAEEDVAPGGVARHRRHRFPGRTESVRARYDTDELAAVAAAADRAGLTTSGYVAAAALAAASGSEPPDASGDRELLGELLQARLAVRRYAVNVNQRKLEQSVVDGLVTMGRALDGPARTGSGCPRMSGKPYGCRLSTPPRLRLHLRATAAGSESAAAGDAAWAAADAATGASTKDLMAGWATPPCAPR